MRHLWRVGYSRPEYLYSLGWRRLFWRFYWFSPELERTMLTAYAHLLNVEPLQGESNNELRERMVAQMRNP